MAVTDDLKSGEIWEDFYSYKEKNCHPLSRQLTGLRRFIDSKGYIEIVEKIENNMPLSIPNKKLISKMGSSAKRPVYTYTENENYVLKLMTYLLIRKYDGIFAPNLYSFRVGKGTKEAVKKLVNHRKISRMYSYKVDVSNYFASVNTDIILPKLEEILCDDKEIYEFFRIQLTDKRAIFNSEIITEEMGIIAGCPTACFLANVYLSRLDRLFYEKRILYARYSDDIILFAATARQRDEAKQQIKDNLARLGLSVNPQKEITTEPNEKWTFLGFSFRNGVVDISPVSAQKLKDKMRRKANALLRWKRRKGLDNIKAAKAFVNVFNRKLYENTVNGEITWARWFFPNINTDETLKMLDSYMQDCIRYIVSESHTKKRYNFCYEDIKSLGYRSLVNEYYRLKKQTAKENKKDRQY